MKIIQWVVVLAAAVPLSIQSEDRNQKIVDAALRHVPTQLLGVVHSATAGLPESSVAISDRMVAGGAPEGFRDFAEFSFGPVLAEELIRAYAENGASRKLLWREVCGIRILSLEQFSSDETGYDWDRLRAVYPEVRAVVRLSLPALDEAQAYGVVRYEVISPEGRAWAALQRFERRPDGSWKDGLGRVGAIWE